MKEFDFVRAGTLSEALEFLAVRHTATRVIAGGTDLMITLRRNDPSWPGPGYILDLTGLDCLRGISREGDRIRIGALTTHTQLAESPLLKDKVPFLSAAAFSVGSPQIRNRGTIGGNIINASPAADTLPPLMALEARCRLVSREGERDVSLTELLTGPYRTSLRPQEILKEVYFQIPGEGTGFSFQKVGRRKALSISRLSVAVLLSLVEGQVGKARVAVGAALATAARLPEVEQFLEGRLLDRDVAQEAGKLAAEKVVEITGRRWSTPYKEPVLLALVRRALLAAGAPQSP